MVEHHVLKTVHLTPPQAPAVKTLAADEFARSGKLAEDGMKQSGGIRPHLQGGMVWFKQGVPGRGDADDSKPGGSRIGDAVFSCSLRSCACLLVCVGEVAPEGGTTQLRITTTLRLTASSRPRLGMVFVGKNMRPVPFEHVDGLLSAPDVLSLNHTAACPLSHLNEGRGDCQY